MPTSKVLGVEPRQSTNKQQCNDQTDQICQEESCEGQEKEEDCEGGQDLHQCELLSNFKRT